MRRNRRDPTAANGEEEGDEEGEVNGDHLQGSTTKSQDGDGSRQTNGKEDGPAYARLVTHFLEGR